MFSNLSFIFVNVTRTIIVSGILCPFGMKIITVCVIYPGTTSKKWNVGPAVNVKQQQQTNKSGKARIQVNKVLKIFLLQNKSTALL